MENHILLIYFTNWITCMYKNVHSFLFFVKVNESCINEHALIDCMYLDIVYYMYIYMLWNIAIWFLSAIFNAEFILSGVMRQTVDFKSYQIDVHWYNRLWMDVHVKTLPADCLFCCFCSENWHGCIHRPGRSLNEKTLPLSPSLKESLRYSSVWNTKSKNDFNNQNWSKAAKQAMNCMRIAFFTISWIYKCGRIAKLLYVYDMTFYDP